MHASSPPRCGARTSTSTVTTSRCTPPRRRRHRPRCPCSWARSPPACCGSRVRSPTARSRGWPTARPSRRTSSRASRPRPRWRGVRHRVWSRACRSRCTTTSTKRGRRRRGNTGSTATCRTTRASSASVDSSVLPTHASWVTRSRWRRNCVPSSTPAPPTCGPPSSPWATTGAHHAPAPARCSNTSYTN